MKNQNSNTKADWHQALLIWSQCCGWLSIPIIIIGLGWHLESTLSTWPWGTIIATAISLCISIRQIIKLAQKAT